MRYFFRHVDTFLSISPANREYLQKYGAKDQQIVDTSFPIDISRLKNQQAALDEQQLNDLRTEFSISQTANVLVVVCKLIPRKRVSDVVNAMAKLADKGAHLLVLGSGECQDELEQQAEGLGVKSRVHFVGFVNQSKLAAYFAISDLMIFPSENEPYGAVVAEGLPFSLPVIIASEIGAIGASAIVGENALMYGVGDVDDMVRQIDHILSDESIKSAFSSYSRSIAEQHDKRMMASEIVKVCKGH